MRTNTFWFIFCLLVLMATILFSSVTFAAVPKSVKCRPVVRSRPLVKIGKPYKAELRHKSKPTGLIFIGDSITSGIR